MKRGRRTDRPGRRSSASHQRTRNSCGRLTCHSGVAFLTPLAVGASACIPAKGHSPLLPSYLSTFFGFARRRGSALQSLRRASDPKPRVGSSPALSGCENGGGRALLCWMPTGGTGVSVRGAYFGHHQSHEIRYALAKVCSQFKRFEGFLAEAKRMTRRTLCVCFVSRVKMSRPAGVLPYERALTEQMKLSPQKLQIAPEKRIISISSPDS